MITAGNNKVAILITYFSLKSMCEREEIEETQLAALAKQTREAAGRNRAEAARELKVARQSIIYAEDDPQKSFFKLRKRIIEKYSDYKVVGPIYYLQRGN